MSQVELGCGLIRIGREWGEPPKPVPKDKEAAEFLDIAYQSGIRFFDTAPAYGLSEKRLGNFLFKLSPTQKAELTIATKFGEHWDDKASKAYPDHRVAVLKASIDRSMAHLGRISVLQLHQTNPENLASSDVDEAISYARSLGIEHFGASVKDVPTALETIDDERFDHLQLPYNVDRGDLLDIIQEASSRGMRIIINRPFNEGRLASTSTYKSKHAAAVEAFRFILQTGFSGVILTGTANSAHLQENMAAFEKASQLEQAI